MTAMGAAFPTHNNLQPDYVVTAPAVSHSVSYSPLAEGVEGTIQSLDAMRRAVLGQIAPDFSGFSDAYNQQAAMAIVGGPWKSEAPQALLAYCRDQIQYINHPWDLQVVQDCRRTLESGTGDCVSKSVCLATLLACWGIESRFVAQAPQDGDFSHVYVEANLDGQWVALDPTADGKDGRPFSSVGWFQRLPDGGFETTYTIF
jgi:hypothetical protein